MYFLTSDTGELGVMQIDNFHSESYSNFDRRLKKEPVNSTAFIPNDSNRVAI